MRIIFRPVLLPFLLLSSLLFQSAMPDVEKQQKRKIIFFADSITEAGVKPGGYIDVLNKMIAEWRLSNQYALSGAGIGGNKVYDLYLRMEQDV